MKVRDLLGVESIQLQGTPTGKEDAIRQMVDLMCKRGNIADPDAYLQGVFAREEEGTTGIGEGIAIPHCKSDAVSAPGLAAMVVPQGVEYDALDGEPVHIIFLIAAPNTEVKCSQCPSCVDFTGFNCIQNCVYCYYLSFFSKIALKHRPHYFHI